LNSCSHCIILLRLLLGKRVDSTVSNLFCSISLLLTIRLKDQNMKNLSAFMIQFMIKLLPGLLLLKTIWKCKFSIILGPCREKNQSHR